MGEKWEKGSSITSKVLFTSPTRRTRPFHVDRRIHFFCLANGRRGGSPGPAGAETNSQPSAVSTLNPSLSSPAVRVSARLQQLQASPQPAAAAEAVRPLAPVARWQ